MANDRVLIICKGCEAWKMILKFFPGKLYNTDNGIIEWMERHSVCHPNLDSGDLGGNPGFEIVTESSVWLDMDKQGIEPPS